MGPVRILQCLLELHQVPLVCYSAAWLGVHALQAGTPYEGEVFSLTILFTESFPYEPPRVRFLNPGAAFCGPAVPVSTSRQHGCFCARCAPVVLERAVHSCCQPHADTCLQLARPLSQCPTTPTYRKRVPYACQVRPMLGVGIAIAG